jgi:hypothetical protein
MVICLICILNEIEKQCNEVTVRSIKNDEGRQANAMHTGDRCCAGVGERWRQVDECGVR